MTTDQPDSPDRTEDSEYVEYCLANVSSERQDAIMAADLRSRGASCLDRCGRCYQTDFVVVDGTLIAGDTCNQFVESLAEGESE